MRPKPPPQPVADDLFRQELVNIINMRHELVRLARLIDWSVFDREFGAQFASPTGRPALPTRLVAGLLYLKHAYALSDEQVVERWVENPYFQHFCGERYFQHEMPCDPSSLVRWRKRIGEAGVEWLLTQTIEAAKASGTMSAASLSTIVVDTTVQPKAIAFPTGYGKRVADEAAAAVFTQMRPHHQKATEYAAEVRPLRTMVETLQPLAEAFKAMIEALLGRRVNFHSLEGQQIARDAAAKIMGAIRAMAPKPAPEAPRPGSACVASPRPHGAPRHRPRSLRPR